MTLAHMYMTPNTYIHDCSLSSCSTQMCYHTGWLNTSHKPNNTDEGRVPFSNSSVKISIHVPKDGHLSARYISLRFLPTISLVVIIQLFRSTSDHPGFQWGSCCSIFGILLNVLQIVVCPFVLFLLAMVLSVL